MSYRSSEYSRPRRIHICQFYCPTLYALICIEDNPVVRKLRLSPQRRWLDGKVTMTTNGKHKRVTNFPILYTESLISLVLLSHSWVSRRGPGKNNCWPIMTSCTCVIQPSAVKGQKDVATGKVLEMEPIGRLRMQQWNSQSLDFRTD